MGLEGQGRGGGGGGGNPKSSASKFYAARAKILPFPVPPLTSPRYRMMQGKLESYVAIRALSFRVAKLLSEPTRNHCPSNYAPALSAPIFRRVIFFPFVTKKPGRAFSSHLGFISLYAWVRKVGWRLEKSLRNFSAHFSLNTILILGASWGTFFLGWNLKVDFWNTFWCSYLGAREVDVILRNVNEIR